MIHIRILALIWVVGLVTPLSAQEDVNKKILNRTFPEWKKVFEDNTSTKTQTGVLLVMGAFGARNPQVIETVSGYMLDPKLDVEVRRVAVQVLGKMGEDAKTAVVPLMDVLTKAEADTLRESAARALGGDLLPAIDAQHYPTLAKALHDKHKGTRLAIAELFNVAGEKSRAVFENVLNAAKDSDVDPLTRMFLIKTLLRFPDNAPMYLPVLVTIAKTKDADPELRKVAVQELGQSADLFKNTEGAPKSILDLLVKEASPVLLEIYKTKTPPASSNTDLENEAWTNLRVAAAISLAKIGGDAKVIWPVARANLADPLPAIRYQAVRLAGVFGKDETETVGDLIERAKFAEIDVQIRLAAMQELAKLGAAVGEEAQAELQKLVDNDNREVIRKAAELTLKTIRGS